MKSLLLPLGISLLVSSCDNPQRTRNPVTYVSGTNNQSSTLNSGYSFGSGTTSSGSTTGTTTSGTTTGSTTGAGFENCDLTKKYQSTDFGFFGLCQSTSDPLVLKYIPGQTSTNSRICLIPIFRDSSGSSTYIGSPQCMYTTAETIIQGRLVKDRSGYETSSMNGIMVMRESLLTPYFNCMNSYAKWPAIACPNGPYTSSYCSTYVQGCPAGAGTSSVCSVTAQNYMSQVCTSFKNTYSGAYVQINL